MKSFINKINQSRYSGIFYVSLSSVLIWLAFAPWKFWPVSFFCMIPIFYYIENNNMRNRPLLKIMGLGCLQAIFISFLGYHWVIDTMVVFGHLPVPAAVLIFILYAIGTNFRWIIFFLLLYWFKKNKDSFQTGNNRLLKFISKRSFFCMGAWGIAEYLGWQLFPYYGGNLVSGNLIFIQIVDFVGVFGVSLILILINILFYEAIICKKKPILAITVLLICHIYGGISYYYWNSKQSNYKTANIGVVQGNTPMKFQSKRSVNRVVEQSLNNMILQSYNIMNKARIQGKPLDIIVWPESSVPYISYERFAQFKKQLNLFQRSHKVEMIIPDLLVKRNYKKRETEMYNNVFLLNKNEEVMENYQKMVLLPFGEFLPLSDLFPAYKKFFSEVSNFTHGNQLSLFSSEIGKIMPLICYEVILPNFVLNFHKKTHQNAQIMINITNDTWFGDSIESSQHLELARLRSIELRMPLIRGVNAGISTYFDITGRNFGETELLTSANSIYTVKIPPKGTATLYTLFGSYLYLMFILFFSGILIYCLYQTMTKKVT